MSALARRPERSVPPEEPAIRLLIVDDSSVARAILSRMIGAQAGFEIVGTASSAAEALTLLQRLTVDVILLDVEMPGGSGLDALPSIIEAGRGARVLIVSSMAEDGAETTIRALALGAADTMPKPVANMFGGQFGAILAERLRRIGRAELGRRRGRPGTSGTPVVLRQVDHWQPACIAVGASTGGIHAINEFLAGLPVRTGLPIYVTQHLPALFMPYFARQVAAASGRTVSVVAHGDIVEPDHVHVAPGDAHLRLERRGNQVRIRLDDAPAPSGCLPSVDPMMESVGEAYGKGALCVILSGMGRDGMAGSARLAARGGVVLAQDEASSTIWGMPGAVAEAGLASALLPPRELASRVAARLGDPNWK